MTEQLKCPECGSTDMICMDGYGTVSKYGKNIMIDIAPDMWLCQTCKKCFPIEELNKKRKEV